MLQKKTGMLGVMPHQRWGLFRVSLTAESISLSCRETAGKWHGTLQRHALPDRDAYLLLPLIGAGRVSCGEVKHRF